MHCGVFTENPPHVQRNPAVSKSIFPEYILNHGDRSDIVPPKREPDGERRFLNTATMPSDDLPSTTRTLGGVGLFVSSVLVAPWVHDALEAVPEVVPRYAVIPITFIGICVSGSLALELSWRRSEHPEASVWTKLWRGELDQSDKEDMFFILSIMLLVTWYDHSSGYSLGVIGVYIALGLSAAVSILWRRWTTGKCKPGPSD